jgi:outer membrane lipoprotein-sorting protein
MRIPRRCAPVTLTLVLCLLSSSCLWTHRVILRGGKRVAPGAAPALMASTREGLEQRIANLYKAIESFQSTVEMTPSIGSVYKGEITEGSGLIKDVRSYVLYRKPDFIRIIGKAPVVRTTEFDMVSSGDAFKVYLVSKNMFVEGRNSAPAASKSVLENLRPEHFLSAMLIRPVDPATEFTLIEDDTDEENALYEILFVRMGSDGKYMLGRTVWFDRLNLSIVRQKVFDEDASTLSDTRYSKWQSWNGVMFPAHIDINRPKDGYGVSMEVLDMQMNLTLGDDKFELNQPDGSQLRKVGESTSGVSK